MPFDLNASYINIQKRIASACSACNRSADSVTLIAASKSQSLESIAKLHSLGLKNFGENYAQELIEKASLLPNTIRWSYIGHLQSNKIRKIMSVAHEIQSVGSAKHIPMLARCAEELNKTPYPIFLEVHIPGDDNKSGIAWDEVLPLAREIETKYASQLILQGLMAIPPVKFAEHWNEEGEKLYKSLRELANDVGLGLLSLGMSQDLEHAIQCGSNIVRVGSALMGSRK